MRRMHRSLLQSNQTVNVDLEMEGSSPQAALSINTDLGNNVLSGTLQVRSLSFAKFLPYYTLFGI